MKRTTSISLRAMLLALLVFGLAPAPASAQFKAAVQGTVTDPAGAVVPGASVTLTSTETGKTQQVTASEEGFYRFSGLAPGRYTLTVEHAGFKKSVLEEVVVSAEATQGVDVVLNAGEVAESVTVTADAAPALETENANVSKAITTEELRRLPQVGRDPYELLRLTPGVIGDGGRNGSGNAVNIPNTSGPGGSNSSVFQVENQVQVSANGQRVSANNFQIDGVSVNSLGWGGAAVVTPNQESVKEVRVLSSSYSAEDGRNSGAQVKVVSQNGTNEFHGSLFLKYNEPGLNAFNKYDGPNQPRQRVEQKFRQFGGSLGGPILKDKLFFFFSYEGLRNTTNRSRLAFVETEEFRALVRSQRPNSLAARLFTAPGVEPRITGTIPVTCANAVQPGTPCAEVGGGLDLGSLFTGTFGRPIGFDRAGGGLDGIPDVELANISIPGRERGHQFNTRIDYNHSDSDYFAVSTYFTRRNDLQTDVGNTLSRPLSDLTFKPFNTAITLTWNHIFTPVTLNEARLNFTRFAFDQLASSAEADFGIPRIKVEGLNLRTTIPGQSTPLRGGEIFFGAERSEVTPGIFAQNTFEFRDTLSHVRGNHALKFGGEVRKEQDNNNLLGGARPEYSFFTLFGLANDAPILEVINTDPQTGAAADAQRYFRTGTYALFVQDDWKLRPNFTVNIGLRWEYFTPISEKQGRLSNFRLGPPGQELTGGRVEVVDRLFEPDRNNFAPRLGFAWSPSRFKDKLVLRGGFGLSYNRIFNNVLANVRGNPPFFSRRFVCCAFTESDTDALRQIFYTFSTNNSPTGFPANPNITPGIDPVTGGLIDRNTGSVISTELYGTEPNLPNAYVYSYSFDGEYLLPHNLVASLGYQGSSSHKLIRTTNLNFVFDADNPSFFQIFFPLPDVNANYNALNARLTRRYAAGFQFDAIYRWSKSIDTLSFEFGGNANQTDPRDIHAQRGPSDFDVTHNFVLSTLWDLPFFRGRRDLVGTLLGGWQINSILNAHTGFPWTPKHCNDLNRDGQGCFERAARYFGGALEPSNENFTRPGGIFPNNAATGGTTQYFDITTLGTPGVGRNSFRGPSYRSVDFSLVKQFGLPSLLRLGEGANFEVRANFFNAFNILNLLPFNYGDDNTFIFTPNFGRAAGAQSGRVIEFQGRLRF
ncbi:MAG TPA: TonB-dependent receptor [Pyrinomonadaceae bacterium]|nr:TonB-dependent receptor [Pyrinomonadaceae bacterium]